MGGSVSVTSLYLFLHPKGLLLPFRVSTFSHSDMSGVLAPFYDFSLQRLDDPIGFLVTAFNRHHFSSSRFLTPCSRAPSFRKVLDPFRSAIVAVLLPD